MMVTFISQCEKKALARTRRILDAFASRIGERTWQTTMTEDGVMAVKHLLLKSVTKNTAVSCHWIRSRRRSEVLWIVGNRRRFNSEGQVPVNTTRQNLLKSDWENDWHYLPLIHSLVAVAALLHDWGKASVLFQSKLQHTAKNGDPLRHEWVSCLLLQALVRLSGSPDDDAGWLNLLLHMDWNEKAIQKQLAAEGEQWKALSALPPLAQLVAWLLVSHHRLPDPGCVDPSKRQRHADHQQAELAELLALIENDWGYTNRQDAAEYTKRIQKCFAFKHGLLHNAPTWCQYIKKWSTRLIQQQASAQQACADGSWRLVLQLARLCLMLGDHYYSSCDADRHWADTTHLFANTDKQGKFKQKLDEHLVGVCRHALQAAQSLARFTDDMAQAHDVRKLRRKSPPAFAWQDQAASAIGQYRKEQAQAATQGWFVVNMASTGKGKTIANAKIMRALSADGDALRYILALGLRTLTLQTGAAYRAQLDLNEQELAVLIGSQAVQELQQQAQRQAERSVQSIGSESLESLVDDGQDDDTCPDVACLSVLFPPQHHQKNRALLYKPVLVCTIDHIMAATETCRGGRYMLPLLRLMSSDLVIDEVDDFDPTDLLAITRLVHLAGMLGRKVMISSATIAPALAEGFFHAYWQGRRIHTAFKQQQQPPVHAMWVDEFKTRIVPISGSSPEAAIDAFKTAHARFIQTRVCALQKQPVKHLAYIIPCEDLLPENRQAATENETPRQSAYFERIREHIQHLHATHHSIDPQTGKKVSFGVVRLANIDPCVALTRHLLVADWANDTAPRVMAYHSRQILLLRNEQEQHLDAVLTRKEQVGEPPKALSHPVIRAHLEHTPAENIIFILVATPVEEVGRDHDFDWALIEPSSYRSIIQLVGRVWRHRSAPDHLTAPNIAILQYNIKTLLTHEAVTFTRPGYEHGQDSQFHLSSKDVYTLLNHPTEPFIINAIPRIQAATTLQPQVRLADLEHAVLHYELADLTRYGAKTLNGWINECWWLTALPQRLNPFRSSEPQIQLFAIADGTSVDMAIKGDLGEWIPCTQRMGITFQSLTNEERARLWLPRNYLALLKSRAEAQCHDTESITQAITRQSQRYGELMLPARLEGKQLVYSDDLGLITSENH